MRIRQSPKVSDVIRSVSITIKNKYKELNYKILRLYKKRKRKIENHVNCTPKVVSKLIFLPQLKASILAKFVH
jgi:hypothetical protein